MELESITAIRQRYQELLSEDPKYNAVLQRLIEHTEDPILSVTVLDAESDLFYSSEQRQLSEALLDLHAINNGITEVKNVIADTVNVLDRSIQSLTGSMQRQYEQAMDLNIICGQKSDFSSVIPVTSDNFSDLPAEVINEKTFGAAVLTSENIPYDIISLSGNGYSGNAFVYKDGIFQNEIDDRSNIDYIADNNDLTIYEYSRLSTKDKKSAVNGVINYDDKEVECVITLAAQSSVCKAEIRSADPELIVRKIEISQDGFSYTTCTDRDIYINRVSDIYNDSSYIYGSATVCFPYASYIRITLAEHSVQDDIIAIQEEDGTIKDVDAYRRKISLQGIQLYRSTYENTVIESDNILEDSAIDKIALFVSEYVPDHFPDRDLIRYAIVLNGREYTIVPANTGQSGTVIIKYAEENTAGNTNTQLIHETIKTIKLKIYINMFNKTETPYVSNIKLCIGKNTGNIYV